MSSRDLPHQPSLRHLKQEAKQFHKALQDGDPQSTERIREGLPRLRPDAPVDDVTLMEVQHVLAREYGYREWPALAAAAELEFDQLSALSDADTQSLLRVTDQKDLVTALKLTSHDVKRRMLTAMSGRVCRFITEEMAFVDPSEAEIVDVQERIHTGSPTCQRRGNRLAPRQRHTVTEASGRTRSATGHRQPHRSPTVVAGPE